MPEMRPLDTASAKRTSKDRDDVARCHNNTHVAKFVFICAFCRSLKLVAWE